LFICKRPSLLHHVRRASGARCGSRRTLENDPSVRAIPEAGCGRRDLRYKQISPKTPPPFRV